MCLIVLAHNVHPQFPLIFAGNRDEFLARPTAPATYWDDAPNVLAGRDLTAGGTWFGVTREGRFAAVTNYRDPSRRHPNPRSRGLLVTEFLCSSEPLSAFAERINHDRNHYDGFNFVFGDTDAVWYVSNRAAPDAAPLAPGVHGLSNHLINTPWPKVERAKRAMSAQLTTLESGRVEQSLLDTLSDQSTVPDDALPQTGVSIQWERILSTAFIRGEGYGTRTSTLLLVDRNGRAAFTERSYDVPGSDRRFELEFERR